jgi:hypothetical protein
LEIDTTYLKNDYVNFVKFNEHSQGRFGKGIGTLSLSKSLFSDEGGQAIFYYEFVCGANCGDGVVLFVEKKESKWLIVREIKVWSR